MFSFVAPSKTPSPHSSPLDQDLNKCCTERARSTSQVWLRRYGHSSAYLNNGNEFQPRFDRYPRSIHHRHLQRCTHVSYRLGWMIFMTYFDYSGAVTLLGILTGRLLPLGIITGWASNRKFLSSVKSYISFSHPTFAIPCCVTS